MRTSTQLTTTGQCDRHPHANITSSADYITRAAAQREVVMRILQGEPIDDIKGEIDSILTSKNCPWENREQKRANLALYENRIKRYIAWENQREQDWPDDYDTTVDFFGETIDVKPDFFVHEEGKTYVVKVKTSRMPNNEQDDIQSYEAYAMALLGKKLFPNDEIIVEINHLADKTSAKERAEIFKSYGHEQKMSTLVYDRSAEVFFQEKHQQEMENGHVCTPEECESCGMRNICHYEEAPISLDIMKEVKPISEIRLTRAQQQVIDYETGVARINAGAGAGKTLVVAMRIVELLKKGYEPEDICLLTFTKAGAEEMTARVVQYCAGFGVLVDPSRLTSTTFNAFCQNIVTAHYQELGYTMPPRVLPEEVRSGIINRLIDQFPHIEEWDYSVVSNAKFAKYSKKSAMNCAKYMFAEIKKEGYTRENNPYSNYTPVSLDLIFQMYREYDNTLHTRNMLEYDDQLLQVNRLLELHPSLFEEIGYKHVIVDEFQDTDLPQIHLLNKIIDTSSFKSFMAVGDDSQSIFAFRHTSPEYMINFGQYFTPNFDDFNLVENHRSTKNIINLANTINNKAENKIDKDLIATKPDGVAPVIEGFYSQKSEYEWIANQIQADIRNGKVPSDIAFLASNRNELQAMASVLTKMGIPSILMNPIPYKNNSRVAALCTFFDSFTSGTTQGLLDYTNVIEHGALKGVPAARLEEIAEEFKQEIIGGQKSISRFMEYAKAMDEEEVDECYQAFLENISYCQSYEELEEFFHDFAMYGDDSMFKREGKYEGVCLTTIHSAKGLEWDNTYLTLSALDRKEYHRNPSKFRSSGEKDENIRKWFVGTTRAREKLVMTGQYVVELSKNELMLNDYVKEAYEIFGKPFGYQTGAFLETQAQEKREALEAATGFELNTLGRRLGTAVGSHHGKSGDTALMDRYRGNHPQPAPAATAQKTEDLSAVEQEFA